MEEQTDRREINGKGKEGDGKESVESGERMKRKKMWPLSLQLFASRVSDRVITDRREKKMYKVMGFGRKSGVEEGRENSVFKVKCESLPNTVPVESERDINCCCPVVSFDNVPNTKYSRTNARPSLIEVSATNNKWFPPHPPTPTNQNANKADSHPHQHHRHHLRLGLPADSCHTEGDSFSSRTRNGINKGCSHYDTINAEDTESTSVCGLPNDTEYHQSTSSIRNKRSDIGRFGSSSIDPLDYSTVIQVYSSSNCETYNSIETTESTPSVIKDSNHSAPSRGRPKIAAMSPECIQSGQCKMLSCDQCLFPDITDFDSSTLLCSHPSKCSSKMASTSGANSTWYRGLCRWAVIAIVLMALVISPSEAGSGHTITAFEYQRKFNRPLDLGECPQRKVAVRTENNQTVVESQRCTLHKAGTIQHMPRELRDSRNVVINSPYGIVHYLGLCGGEAASFLGILVSGDCVAVEIASRLTFNEKTLVRAFVGLYRKSLDVLDSKGNITHGMVRYYKDKFYLKNRSYGTMDLIIVQFRFRTSQMKEEAKNIKLESTSMSDYMKAMEQLIGRPRGVSVINLSTATSSTYEIARFREWDWDRAIRHVQIVERDILILQQEITNNHLLPQPHLKYRLFPFVDSENGSLRNTKPLSWEKISMLEVKLRHAIGVVRKTAKKCRGDKSNTCRRVRRMRRQLFETYREIHEGRSRWVDLSKERKTNFATEYTTTVDTLSRVTKNLAQEVRRNRRHIKNEELKSKQNRPNDTIRLYNPRRSGRSREYSFHDTMKKMAIRHARSKLRRRNRRLKG